jgi:hypothetical protein
VHAFRFGGLNRSFIIFQIKEKCSFPAELFRDINNRE